LIFNGNRWTKQIDALVLPFREVFAAVFFVGLGLIFDPRLLWNEPVLMGSALLGVILLKSIAATVALRLTGLPIVRAFAMGIGLAHIGEFAFVLALLGAQSGTISEEAYQRIVAIAVGSLILTPPLMKAGLRLIQEDTVAEEHHLVGKKQSIDSLRATVIGAGPIGRRIASQLETLGKDVCLIDLSPINLHSFAQEGFRTVAGDATDPQILRIAEVPSSVLTVVCVPSDSIAIQIVRVVTKVNKGGRLIVRCRYQSSAPKLQTAGADHVVIEETEATLALLKALQKMEL